MRLFFQPKCGYIAKNLGSAALFLFRGQFHLLAGPVLDPDGCSGKTKPLANLVLQKALIGKMQLDVFVSKQNERRG